MAQRAVSLPGVLSGCPFAAKNVDLVGYDLDMCRIYAMPNSAQVIAMQVRRNPANQKLKNNPMGQAGTVFPNNDAVASPLLCASPFPAAGLRIDFYFIEDFSQELAI